MVCRSCSIIAYFDCSLTSTNISGTLAPGRSAAAQRPYVTWRRWVVRVCPLFIGVPAQHNMRSSSAMAPWSSEGRLTLLFDMAVSATFAMALTTTCAVNPVCALAERDNAAGTKSGRMTPMVPGAFADTGAAWMPGRTVHTRKRMERHRTRDRHRRSFHASHSRTFLLKYRSVSRKEKGGAHSAVSFRRQRNALMV
jgi:hypothetical protein